MRSLLRFITLVALSICSSLVAQDAATPPQQTQPSKTPQPPKPPAPTGSIHGFVFCGDTHKPARGALVMVMGLPSNKEPQNGNPGMTRTAIDGSYTIANVTEGEYGVAAFLPGYLSPFDNISADEMEGNQGMFKRIAASGTATVTAHQTASHDLTLTRGATISGRVFFSDGSPASQVNILIEDINAKPYHPKQGQPDIDVGAWLRTMFTHQTNATDDEGHFRISGLAPATYRVAAVSASTSGMENNDLEGMAFFAGVISDPSSLHVYSGDTLHKNAAKTYELRAGDNVSGIDIVIPLNAFHQVRGVLSAVDGRAINNGSLTLTDSTDDSVHFKSATGSDGTFAFATVPSGTYKLAVTGAHISVRNPDQDPNIPDRFAGQKTTNAFADADTNLIVKDTDLLDVSFPLTEIPLPANENKPNTQPPPPAPPQ